MAGIAATDMHAGIAMNHTLPGREFFIDNLLVRIHFIIVMIRWIGLAPWEPHTTVQAPHAATPRSQFQDNYFSEMRGGSEEGSYLRLIDLCITQL